MTPCTSATLRGQMREAGMCVPYGARSRPGQHSPAEALVDNVVCFVRGSVVKADSGFPYGISRVTTGARGASYTAGPSPDLSPARTLVPPPVVTLTRPL